MGYQGDRGYTVAEEPDLEMRGWAWGTAIGLQAVDDLQPSDELVDLAMQSVEGNMTLRECSERIDRRYAYRARLRAEDQETEEADRVSARMAMLLCEPACDLSASALVEIHRRLFTGLDERAGQYRMENVTCAEEILDGASVTYAEASGLARVLDDVLAREAAWSYAGLSADDVSLHLAQFAATLFRVHPFDRGNVRTTTVFLLRHLRSLGYQEMADTFAEGAVYYRRALVCAAYQNLPQGITASSVYLGRFLGNLLLGQENELDEEDLTLANREPATERVLAPTPDAAAPVRLTRVNLVGPQKAHHQKVNIRKADIPKGDIRKRPQTNSAGAGGAFSNKTARHIEMLRERFGEDGIWGRSDVIEILGIRGSGASKMIGNLLDAGIIEPVSGYGKGRYHFAARNEGETT